MKQNFKLLSLGLLVALLLAAWILRHAVTDDDPPASAAAEPLPSLNETLLRDKPMTSDLPKDPRLIEKFTDMEDVKTMGKEEIERYLMIEGRTAKSLTTAYWLTKNPKFLEELKDVAGQSLPALSTLAMALPSPEDRLVWINRFIIADPNNKLGFFLKMDAELHMGQLSSAVLSLNEALDAQKIHQYDAEMVLEQRRAWQLLGTDPITARIRVERHDISSKQASLQVSMALNDMWKKMAENSDTDQKLDNVTAFLEAGRAIAGSNQLSTVNSDRHALMAESHFLKLLPPDVKFGDDGLTVKDRITQVNKEIFDDVDAEARLDNTLKSADVELVDQYFERYDMLGSKAAMDWVLEQTKIN